MAPWHWPYRTVYLVGCLVCILLLGYAWYAEPLAGLATCSTCVIEVAAFLWMALWYVLGGLHAPNDRRRWIYMALVVLGALAGATTAITHMLAPATTAVPCRAASCASAAWQFLGFSMNVWAVVWYVLLAAFAIHGAVHPYSPRQLARMHEAQAD